MTFATLSDIRAALQDLPPPDAAALTAAAARNGQLTKPPGALARLEDLAIWLGGCRAPTSPPSPRLRS